MSAGTSASFCLIVCFLVCSSGAQKIITAELGQDVILPCKVPNIKITAVEWTRPGLEPEHVLFYRDGRLDPHNQHPSYQNQVYLQDKQMKDGNVSLILKNVTMNNTGTYECRIFEEEMNELISIILEVLPPGKTDESTGDGGDKTGGDKVGITRGHPGAVGCGILLLAVLASVGFLTLRSHMRQKPNIPVPPDEEAAGQML